MGPLGIGSRRERESARGRGDEAQAHSWTHQLRELGLLGSFLLSFYFFFYNGDPSHTSASRLPWGLREAGSWEGL